MDLYDVIGDLDVDNVFLYVGDAVRWDFLPDDVRNEGLVVKCIAGSIHTPTSFATMVSGHYLPTHNVVDFSRTLPSTLPNILHSEGVSTAFINSINSAEFNDDPHSNGMLSSVLDKSEAEMDTLRTIEQPFFVMERGPGGHAPYGGFEGNGWEYFESRGAAPNEKYVQEYRESVRTDIDWFFRRLRILKERGLLEDTLVIYTSDHGELIGESGLLGHNGPIARELVETPCVFLHPDIEHTTIQESVIRHVDLAPTIASLMDEPLDDDTAGNDLTKEPLASRGPSYYQATASFPGLSSREFQFDYSSVWDGTGGYIYPNCSLTTRAGAYMKQIVTGPSREFLRAHKKVGLYKYLRGVHKQGAPAFSRVEALDVLDKINNREQYAGEEVNVRKEQLRNLGYME